jgi:hypothetical protein
MVSGELGLISALPHNLLVDASTIYLKKEETFLKLQSYQNIF